MNDLVKQPKLDAKAKSVIAVVVMFGIISCFGDVIYEGARSANGQYFGKLAMSATTLGIVYGFGEFLGYAVRLLSGAISDKTGKHWTLIFIGYGSLVVVPIMGLTTNHTILCILLLLERIGKALRNPPKDTILSQVAQSHVGTGFVFGLQEALDQLGAFAGPMVFTLALSKGSEVVDYQRGYQFLFLALILVMGSVVVAYKRVSKYNLTNTDTIDRGTDRLTSTFWLYCIFSTFAAFGFVAWTLIGLHASNNTLTNGLTESNITTFYSVAMIIDAVMAMIIGKIYDTIKKKKNNKKAGLLCLIFIPIVTAILPFVAFSNSKFTWIVGIVIFGIIMGAHETVMRSAIADITSFKKRGTAYGIFNCFYGGALFLGSAAMGWLYDNVSILSIEIVVVVAEAIALLVYVAMSKNVHKGDADVKDAPAAKA